MDIPSFNGFDWFFLTLVLIETYKVSQRLLYLTNPPDPKPVPVGQIEDAMVIHDFREAVAISGGELRRWYAWLLVFGLMVLS